MSRRSRLQPDLTKFFEFQYGIARRDQIVGISVTDNYLRWRLETGQWQVILPSTYALFRGDLTVEQRASAGLLYGGPQSQLTGAVALRFWGMRYAPLDERVMILLPTVKRVSSHPQFRMVRTDRLAEPAVMGGLRVAPVARAVADAARERIDLRTARAIVTEAVQRGLVTGDQLSAELLTGPRRGSKDLRRAVSDVAGGARSGPEAELRDLCRASDVLPEIMWNPALAGPDGAALPTPDGWLEDVGLALEVDSREFHESPELWARTLHRHNQLTAVGVVVLHITPREIRRDPGAVLALIEKTYIDLLRVGRRHRVTRTR